MPLFCLKRCTTFLPTKIKYKFLSRIYREVKIGYFTNISKSYYLYCSLCLNHSGCQLVFLIYKYFSLLKYFAIFFFKFYIFEKWSGKKRGRGGTKKEIEKWERKTEETPSTGLFPKWMQQPRLDQVKAKTKDLHRAAGTWAIITCWLLGLSAGCWAGNRGGAWILATAKCNLGASHAA